MKKRQNFHDYLEGLSVFQDSFTESLISYAEINRDWINYTEEKIKSGTLRGFIKDEKRQLKICKEQERQIKIFIKFLDKEEKEYNKITKTQEYKKWLEKDSEEPFFEDIEFIPAYIDEKCGLKVLDFTDTLGFVLDSIRDDIGEIIGRENLPEDLHIDNCPIGFTLAVIIQEKNIDIEDKDWYAICVTTYEDIEYLIDIINYDIEKLLEPAEL
jgi:hypothetical protein